MNVQFNVVTVCTKSLMKIEITQDWTVLRLSVHSTRAPDTGKWKRKAQVTDFPKKLSGGDD